MSPFDDGFGADPEFGAELGLELDGEPADGQALGGEPEAGPEEPWPDESQRLDRDYFSSYADPGVHRLMIGDRARTDAYRRALEELVRPGMRVLDVGTGTGILALIAARAGAIVTAVDESSIVEVAQRLADANGLAGRIEFHRGRIEDLSFGHDFDLIVSEWMGFFALAECMFRSVLIARDRHLAPGGILVPGRLELYLAPLEHARLHLEHGTGLWERPVYGFDFREMIEHELRSLITTAVECHESALLGPPACLLDLELGEAAVDDFFFDSSFELEIERQGRLHGFGGWFAVQLSPQVRLATGPMDPRTHWRQSYFPVRPFLVEAGDRLRVTMRAVARDYGDRRLPLYLLDVAQWRAGREIHRCFYRHDGSFE